MTLTPTEQRLASKAGAHKSWANTLDRPARTLPARLGLEEKFLREADGDPERAASVRKAHYARMTLASIEARRRGKVGKVLDANPRDDREEAA